MLTAFIRAFRTPDLRKKLLFTLGILVLFRFGSSLPTPGINEANVSLCSGLAAKTNAAGVYQIVNLLSGNALKYMSVFALGIMPYITASIILQLLTVVIPRLETLKQGGPGRAGQDHPVHPVPDRRPGDPAVHRRTSSWPARARCSSGCGARDQSTRSSRTARSSPSPPW